MDILDYTTYEEVRAVSGLSSQELTDSELALEIYGNSLSLDLGEVDLPDDAPGPGPLETRFLEIAAILEASRTTAEQKLYNLTRVFSTYSVALAAVNSLSIKAPKTISDSKATLSRFSSEATFQDVIARLEKLLGDVRYKIENINETSVTSITYMSAVSPATDVVTNE